MDKLGSQERPIRVRVRTEERGAFITEVCDKRGWRCALQLEPHKPEDLSELEQALKLAQSSAVQACGRTESRPYWSNHDGWRHAVSDAGRMPPVSRGGGSREIQFDTLVHDLDRMSNQVISLIHDGLFDKAEQVCRQLREQHPDHVDGLDRLAMVCEAKGEKAKAAQYYRQAAEFMKSKPGFDREAVQWALSEAARLEAEQST
jgi:tetratricopeptide (TPR) repeat protein